MWMSNTATTALLMPILEAVLNELERHKVMTDVVKDEQQEAEDSLQNEQREPLQDCSGSSSNELAFENQ